MRIRPLVTGDVPAALALNQSEVPRVGALEAGAFQRLLAMGEIALAAESDDGVLAGFLIALPPGCDYASVNYRFFERRGTDHAYVDRVVVGADFRRQGVAGLLYDELDEAARLAGRDEITCEVNVRPPNAASLAFHLGREFREVGRHDANGVRVVLLARVLDDEPPIRGLQSLDESDVGDDPMATLRSWLDEAATAGIVDHTAMALATVDTDGGPDARMVLVRGIDGRGVRFYTNLRSAKARQLATQPEAAGVFFWAELHRQVRLRGRVLPLSDAESDAYFTTRPPEAQLGAWASDQSEPIGSRDELEERLAQVRARFGDGPVPRPGHWGGYLLAVDAVELWQGREGRLHDRLHYRRDGERWSGVRLQP